MSSLALFSGKFGGNKGIWFSTVNLPHPS